MLSHPRHMIRDTATYRPYQKARGQAGRKLGPQSLKALASQVLERNIQEGQHNPVSHEVLRSPLACFRWIA